MRQVVFTVVHPETFFFSWDSKDDIWYDTYYGQKTLRCLKSLTDKIVAQELPLICIREFLINQASNSGTLGLLHHLTAYNLEASGLASLTSIDNTNSSFREYWTLNGGVPLADEAESLNEMSEIVRLCHGLLF